jgi:hypothetical protein
MARFVNVGGLKVKLPKGKAGLGTKERTALSKLMSNPPRRGLRRTANCPVIFFKKGALAVQRCEGSKLRAHNRRQCRAKSAGRGKTRGMFVPCK